MGFHGRNRKAGKDEQDSMELRLIPPRGDYQTLLSFQKAEVVYDLKFQFTHRFLAKGGRTVDQMIQAARSGKKNLLEGSKAGRTSKETELKLTNVARASLEELLDDYRHFLRVRGYREWAKDSREALYVRRLGRQTPQTYDLYREFVETFEAAASTLTMPFLRPMRFWRTSRWSTQLKLGATLRSRSGRIRRSWIMTDRHRRLVIFRDLSAQNVQPSNYQAAAGGIDVIL
jgi:hypothetical protein